MGIHGPASKLLSSISLLLDLVDGMGANFQVFLIANVPAHGGGYSYQCVGAFNHYYCFGVRPLRALYRFFSLLRVRENAALVRDELRSFSTWNLQDDPLEAWMNPAVPCPYAVSLLSIAWTIDLEHLPYISKYSLGNGLLDARKDCWHRGQYRFLPIPVKVSTKKASAWSISRISKDRPTVSFARPAHVQDRRGSTYVKSIRHGFIDGPGTGPRKMKNFL
ncbi:hypothetical protein TRAPUB_2615 [Trametes pubescens]|uniref:Uncharacterized protein n=1 Tax=Trametes pubescens TaxID=154538 RepID=A0A1M2VG47_TRAPU|nr:hypothetical protein TRAPUB_2615 [Trametes pubescens]